MNFFSNLMAVVLCLNMGVAQAAPSFYDVADIGLRFGRVAGAFSGLAVSAVCIVQYSKKLQESAGASEVILQFCHKKFKEHGLDPKNIQIKVMVNNTGIIEVFGAYLVLHPIAAKEFEKALENSSDEQSINVVKIYSTLIDHEIAHIKNNDAPFKRGAMLLTASVLVYGAATSFMQLPRVSPLFQKPTNVKDFFKTYMAYFLINGVSVHLIKNIFGCYSRYQENRADAYALEYAQDPQALRCTANFFEICENTTLDFLCGADLNSGILYTNKVLLLNIRELLTQQYQTYLASSQLEAKEDVRSWMQQQKRWLRFIKYMVDAEHPSGYERADRFRAAADALEAQEA
jgi:hypothetical protein